MQKRWIAVFGLMLACLPHALAQTASVVTPADTQKLSPHDFFYAGRTAGVQMRNTAAAKSAAGKVAVAGLVDTSGYSSQVAEKFQGFLMSETPITLGGKKLGIGAYGIGLVGTELIVTDLSGATVLAVPVKTDAELKRPVPIKFALAGNALRLYLGKKYLDVDLAGTK